VKDGGLGVRRVSSLAIPAFLASAASTLNLKDDILSGSICSNSQHLQSYLTAWSTAYGAVPDTLPSKQPFWDRPGVLTDRAIVGLRLGLSLCVLHQCQCGSLVSSTGVHSFSLQAYLSPKHLMVSHVQMANVRTASLWCRGKRANPLLGTQLSSALWQTLIRPPENCDVAQCNFCATLAHFGLFFCGLHVDCRLL